MHIPVDDTVYEMSSITVSQEAIHKVQRDGRLLETAGFRHDAHRTAAERAYRAAEELLTPCASLRNLVLNLDLDYLYSREARNVAAWYPLTTLSTSPPPRADEPEYTSWDEFQLRAYAQAINEGMAKLVPAIRASLYSYIRAIKKDGQAAVSSGLLHGRDILVVREHREERLPADLSLEDTRAGGAYFLATLIPSKEHRAGWMNLAEAPHTPVIVHIQSRKDETHWAFMGYILPQPPSEPTAMMPSMLVRLHDEGFLLPLQTGSVRSERLIAKRFESASSFAGLRGNQESVALHVARLPSLLPIEMQMQSVRHVPLGRQHALLRPSHAIFEESPVSNGVNKGREITLFLDSFSKAVDSYVKLHLSRDQLRFAIHFIHYLLYRSLGDTGAFYAILDNALAATRPITLACAILLSKMTPVVRSCLEQSLALDPAIFGKRPLAELVDRVVNSRIAVIGSAWTAVDAACESLCCMTKQIKADGKQAPVQAVRHGTFGKALEQPSLLAAHPYVVAAPFLAPEAESDHDATQDLAKVRSLIKKLVHEAKQKAKAEWIASGKTKKDPGWAQYMRNWQETEGNAIREAHGDPPEATPEEHREGGRSQAIVQVLHRLMHEPAKFATPNTGGIASLPDTIVETLASVDLFSNPDYVHFYPTSHLSRMAQQMRESARRKVIYIINDGSSLSVAELVATVSAGRGVVFAGTESELGQILTP